MIDRMIALSIFLFVLISSTSTLQENKNVSNWFDESDHSLSRHEQLINACLMCYKETEAENEFPNSTIAPHIRNFLEESENIKKSDLFQMIQRIPKGGALHVHHEFMVHRDWVFNATFNYVDNLYICNENGQYKLKFFKQPANDCNWKSMKYMRANSVALDGQIRKRMTITAKDAKAAHENPNAVESKIGKIYRFIEGLLNYKPVAEDHFYQGLKDLYDDGVNYLELRSPIPTFYDLEGTTYNKTEVLHILQNITERFKENHPDFIGVKIIYTRSHQKSKRELFKFLGEAMQLKKAFPDFIAGVDFTGPYRKSPHMKAYLEVLHQVQKEMNLFFDARKVNSINMIEQKDLSQALSLKPTRIGYGDAIIQHPELLQTVKNDKIALEFSPISNQMRKPNNDIRTASQLFDEGVPVVISNNNPHLCGATGLSYDFYDAFISLMPKKADLLTLKQLAKNSIIYSSLSQDDQARALSLWKEQWINFVKLYVEEEPTKKK